MRPLLSFVLVLVAAVTPLAVAQSTVDEPSGQKTLAATMNVYVFPAEGQATDQQHKHEAECYTWAVSNTGTDPFDLSKAAQAQQQQADAAKQEVAQAGQGAGAKGAVVGAAGGALIGQIASDDAGKGAAIGAGVGLVAGRRARRRGQDQATEQIEEQTAQVQQATQTQIDNFKKAFSVCLEAKEYMVRF